VRRALSVLEEGVENGSLRKNIVPSVIRDLIYGGIEHAVWRYIFTDGELEIGMLADQLADVILDGIVGDVRTDIANESIAHQEAHQETVVRLERAVTRLESTLEERSTT
jgi:hypothetical protein